MNMRPAGYVAAPGYLARLALLLIALPLSAFAQGNPQASGKSPARLQLQPQVLQQIQATQTEKASWTSVQRKISSNLLLATKRRLGQAMVAGLPALRQSITVDQAGRVLVDINAAVGAALLSRIGALGGQVVNSYGNHSAIRARIPLDRIQTLAAEAAVRSIRAADRAITNLVVSQGDAAHKANQARNAFGVDGSLLKIGVLSDSVDALPDLQVAGELPEDVTVLPGQSGNPGTSEGTAMLEIVHDLAPGAQLFFATAVGSQAAFAQNIRDLRFTFGCDVIVDDVFFFAEPAFQDGIIAQAVEAVVADGAVYFSSAGNSGNLNDHTSGVWEGDFVATTAPPSVGGTAHNFGGGDNFNVVVFDTPFAFILQWSDPTGASANDYDLFLLDASLGTVLDASTDAQDGNGDPIEGISSFGFDDTGNKLVVIKFPDAEDRFLRLCAISGVLAHATAGQTSGHAAAAAAFGVAAVNTSTAGGSGGVFNGSESVELFSSDGPRHVFYEADGTPITPGDFSSTGGTVRNKPDLAAADGVSTATPGFAPFFGTSAAAPHAAAIAILLKSQDPTLTPDDVRTILTGNTLDIEAPGFDRDSGFGIVDARSALNAVSGCPPPIAACQNITRSLIPDNDNVDMVVVTAGEINNRSSAGSSSCAPVLLEIKKTLGGDFGPDVTFDCGEVGPRDVTLRVTQIGGRTDACIAKVTVRDDTPPDLTCQNIAISLDANGQASITPGDVLQATSDTCGTVNMISVMPDSFTCADTGPNIVTLTVDDGNGNVSTCLAAVTVQDIDSDGDGTPDCNDGCPNNPAKIDPGVCGCDTPDLDADGDGVINCADACPNDLEKVVPGICGCGTPDTDTDGDGTPDCIDPCPTTTDTDGDGVDDCLDNCPDTANPDQADADGDGIGDACRCDQPNSVKADAGGNLTINVGESIALGGGPPAVGGVPPYVYQWQVRIGETVQEFSSVRPLFTPEQEGVFMVNLVVTDSEGCSSSATAEITVSGGGGPIGFFINALCADGLGAAMIPMTLLGIGWLRRRQRTGERREESASER